MNESQEPDVSNPVQKIDIKQPRWEKLLDNASKVFTVLGGIAMIVVTIYFSIVASQLSEQSIKVSETQRKYSIQPSLEVLSNVNYTENYDEIVVPIRNYGTGQAIEVRALVAYDGEIRGEAHHLFITIGDDPVVRGNVLQNAPGTQQQMFTLGESKAKDWIASGETVQFKFNPWLNVDRPDQVQQIHPNREFSIYISFLDIDRNEYLTITKLPIGGKSALIAIAGGKSRLNDSLLTLSKKVKLFDSKTYDDINFRTGTGWFISLGESTDTTGTISNSDSNDNK